MKLNPLELRSGQQECTYTDAEDRGLNYFIWMWMKTMPTFSFKRMGRFHTSQMWAMGIRWS